MSEQKADDYEREWPRLALAELSQADDWPAIWRSALVSLLELGAAQCHGCRRWFADTSALQFCTSNCRGQMYCAACRHQCVTCRQHFCIECEDSSWEWEKRHGLPKIQCSKCWGK
jgi:hypothetical protein